MKRRTFLVCTAALFCSAFLAVGCTQKTSQPVLQQIEYSNLADLDTQDLLSKLLQDAGVSDLRIQTFFDHVQKFNNAVDPAWLTTGFKNAKPSDLKYDPSSMQAAWTEKYDTFPGWNCRITACGLFGDFITVTGKADLDSAEDTLFMDYETLDSDPESLCGDELDIYAGNDDYIVPVMSLGGRGVISVLGNLLPEAVCKMCSLCAKGDFSSAAKLQMKLMPLIDALFCDVNPIPIKEALSLSGFDAGPLRLPLYPLSEEKHEKLCSVLKDFDIV